MPIDPLAEILNQKKSAAPLDPLQESLKPEIFDPLEEKIMKPGKPDLPGGDPLGDLLFERSKKKEGVGSKEWYEARQAQRIKNRPPDLTDEDLKRDVLGDWMKGNWRDLKAVPQVVAGGAIKGFSDIVDTAAGLADYLPGMEGARFDPTIMLKKGILIDKIGSGKKSVKNLTKEELAILSYKGPNLLKSLVNPITRKVSKFAQEKLIDPAKMNPLGKVYFEGVGHLAANLPPITYFTKVLGPVRGMALHGSLKGLSEGDLKEALLGGTAGAFMGGLGKFTKIIRPRYLRALSEATGFGSISAIQKGIREGRIPDIDEHIMSDFLTGLAFGLKGKPGKGKESEVSPVRKESTAVEPLKPVEKYESVHPDTMEPAVVTEWKDGLKLKTIDSATPEGKPVRTIDQVQKIGKGDHLSLHHYRELIPEFVEKGGEYLSSPGDTHPAVLKAVQQVAAEKGYRVETFGQNDSGGPRLRVFKGEPSATPGEPADVNKTRVFKPGPGEDVLDLDKTRVFEPGPGEIAQEQSPGTGQMEVSKYRRNTMETILPEEVLKDAPKKDFLYETESNQKQLDIASRAIEVNLEGEISNLLGKKALESGVDGAKIYAINKKLVESGDYKRAAEFNKEVTPKITSTAQALQSISIAKQCSPEGILQTANKILNEARQQGGGERFDRMLKRKLKGNEFIDEDFAKELIERAKGIEKMPEGYEKDAAIAKTLKVINDRIPKSIGRKSATLQTMAQLLNAKTSGRNFFGNLAFAGVDTLTKTIFGAPLDFFLSLRTGQRSIKLTTPKEIVDYWKEFGQSMKKGAKEAWQGIDTSGLELKRMLGKGGDKILKELTGEESGNVLGQHSIRMGTFNKGFFGVLENLLGVSLRAPDRAFFSATFKTSLNNAMRAKKINKPSQEMVADAIADGLYATYQDINVLSRTFMKLKKNLNLGLEFGLGDMVLKYPKTPANLIARGIDYSPIGLMKGIYKVFDVVRNKGEGRYQQKKSVMDLSRGLTGTGIFLAGMLLKNLGIVTGVREEDKKVRNLMKAGGMRQYSINIDAFRRFLLSGLDEEVCKGRFSDTILSFDWFQPISNSFSMGIDFSDRMQKSKFKESGITAFDFLSPLITSVESGFKSISDQPLFQGVESLFRSGDVWEGITEVLKSVPASFIPTLFGQFRYLMDPKFRETKDENRGFLEETYNKIKNKLPVLSNSLPVQRNIVGEEAQIPRSDAGKLLDVLNVFVNPALVNKYYAGPGLQFIDELYRETGETKHIPRDVTDTKALSLKGKKIPLTMEQRNRYQELLGKQVGHIIDRIIKNPLFLKMDKSQQVTYINRILNMLGLRARKMLLTEIVGGKRP